MQIKIKLMHVLLILFTFYNVEMSFAQKVKVKGSIVDSNSESVIGANVAIKGTTIGTITDLDGKFTLEANVGSTLSITYLGFVPKEVIVTKDPVMKIQLKENAQELEEVVVVGYGTQKKITTIGAQAGIKDVSELKQPVANLSSVLAGRVSGIVGMQRTGEPGKDAASIWVRGVATLGSTTPLVLVDGVERSMNDLNPEDIETFSILKDASATAVYGVRGANGVVIITTKTGQIGKPKVRVEYTEGISKFTKLPEMADGITYMQAANEASINSNVDIPFSAEKIRKTASGEDPYLYPNVNWYDQIFKDYGHNRRASVNVNGGSENVQYYVSVSYYNESGMFKTDALSTYNSDISFTRYNFNSSLNMKVTSTTDLKFNAKGTLSDSNGPFISASDIFGTVFKMPAIQMPVMYPGGKVPFISTGGGLMNPLAQLTKKGYKSTNNNKLMADLTLNQKLDFITKGLSLKALFAYDTENETYLNREAGYTAYWAYDRDENGDLILVQQGAAASDYLTFSRGTNTNQRKYYLEAALNYARRFGGHSVTGLLLSNASDRSNLNAGDLQSSLPYRTLGLAGRATYSYKDRYMAEYNFGYNGAEQFSPKKRFGFFPSYGLGWVLSNESFFQPLSEYVDMLKVRASYGKVGSSELSGRRFAYLSTVDGGNGGYTFGNGASNVSYDGYDIKDYAVNVSWETSTKSNLGMDITLLKNALTLNFDLFKERREDIFLSRGSVPASIGLRSGVTGNLGIVENKGFEVSVDFTKRIDKVTLGLKGNFSYNHNKIIEDDSPVKPYPWMESRGASVNQSYGYINEGYYTQEDIDNPKVAKTSQVVYAGDLKYKDLNGDGVIDDYDKTYIGYGQVPRLVYGFGTTMEWKGFSFGAFFQGVGKCDVFVNGTDFVPFAYNLSKGNLFSNINDRWITGVNENQNAFYPRLSMGNPNQNYVTSTHWIQNGAFCRLKTLDFGYTIPKEITHKAGISNLRVYILATNVFTLSSFKLWDPELGNGTGTAYPNISTYSLGLSFQF